MRGLLSITSRVYPRSLVFNLRQRMVITIVVAVILLFGVFATGLVLGPERMSVNLSLKNSPPSLTNPFGTDWLGRDMLARTIQGLSLSVVVGILAASISALIALLLSLLASWNKAADHFVTWLIDLFLSVPHLVMLILISFSVGGGVKGVVIGLSLTHWPSLARVLRAELLQIRTAEYVKVSCRLGKTNWWIARRHFLPHLLPQLLVGCMLLFPHAILHEAAITFLGFGLPAEQPAIGIILSESMKYLSTGMWWLAFFPGLLLFMVVGIFNMLGNNVSKLIDPFHAKK